MIFKNARFITHIFGAIMRGCRLTFLALGTSHVIPAQGNGSIFPVFDEICARNTMLQIGTLTSNS